MSNTSKAFVTVEDIDEITSQFIRDSSLSLSREGRNYKAKMMAILSLAEECINAGYEIPYTKED